MSTSSLQAEKTVYTSLTLFSDTKLNVENGAVFYSRETPRSLRGGPGLFFAMVPDILGGARPLRGSQLDYAPVFVLILGGRFKSRCRYGVSNVLDMAYWGFLGVVTTFDIFQNIHILYLQYGVLVFTGYDVLIMWSSSMIIMVNEISLNYVDDVPVVEPNQHDDVLVVPEPVLVDEDKDLEEDEFKEEEDPQEEEDDIEMTCPYEEVDPLNPPPPASESKPNDEMSCDPIGHEDEDIDSLFGRMVNFSRRLYGRETAHALVEKKGKAKDKFYGKLILDLGNEVRFRVEQGTAAIGKLVECKKLKKELEKARDVFEERPNEAINIPIKDEKSPSSELQGSPQSVDVAIAAERERQVKVRNDASRSGPVRGAVELRRWFEKTESVFRISECVEGKKVRFAAATLEGLTLTWWNYKIVTMGLETVNRMPWTEMKQLTTAEFYPIEEIQRMEHELWNLKVKEYDIVAYTQRFNELALMYNIKGEVTSSKPADLNEAVRMAHKLMEHKSQARNERILEGKKRKWESFQSGNSSGKGNQNDNYRQTLQNNQKQGNARAMVTAPTDAKLPLCERCFTRHVG
ncbi:reverse transcriptase domain-containing protein [Tanacetum coccineum]|uniref:Reverse transcriptase domain-containing protein n=1 Tax=Tanacetum coccineum TaxID=301880 RepID=A0ABQ5BY44_9ASTR